MESTAHAVTYLLVTSLFNEPHRHWEIVRVVTAACDTACLKGEQVLGMCGWEVISTDCVPLPVGACGKEMSASAQHYLAVSLGISA